LKTLSVAWGCQWAWWSGLLAVLQKGFKQKKRTQCLRSGPQAAVIIANLENRFLNLDAALDFN
jgi:hypothetical protein